MCLNKIYFTSEDIPTATKWTSGSINQRTIVISQVMLQIIASRQPSSETFVSVKCALKNVWIARDMAQGENYTKTNI